MGKFDEETQKKSNLIWISSIYVESNDFQVRLGAPLAGDSIDYLQFPRDLDAGRVQGQHGRHGHPAP